MTHSIYSSVDSSQLNMYFQINVSINHDITNYTLQTNFVMKERTNSMHYMYLSVMQMLFMFICVFEGAEIHFILRHTFDIHMQIRKIGGILHKKNKHISNDYQIYHNDQKGPDTSYCGNERAKKWTLRLLVSTSLTCFGSYKDLSILY